MHGGFQDVGAVRYRESTHENVMIFSSKFTRLKDLPTGLYSVVFAVLLCAPRTSVCKLVQYFDWARIVRIFTAVLYVRRADTATVCIYLLFVFSVNSLLSPS